MVGGPRRLRRVCQFYLSEKRLARDADDAINGLWAWVILRQPARPVQAGLLFGLGPCPAHAAHHLKALRLPSPFLLPLGDLFRPEHLRLCTHVHPLQRLITHHHRKLFPGLVRLALAQGEIVWPVLLRRHLDQFAGRRLVVPAVNAGMRRPSSPTTLVPIP